MSNVASSGPLQRQAAYTEGSALETLQERRESEEIAGEFGARLSSHESTKEKGDQGEITVCRHFDPT